MNSWQRIKWRDWCNNGADPFVHWQIAVLFCFRNAMKYLCELQPTDFDLSKTAIQDGIHIVFAIGFIVPVKAMLVARSKDIHCTLIMERVMYCLIEFGHSGEHRTTQQIRHVYIYLFFFDKISLTYLSIYLKLS